MVSEITRDELKQKLDHPRRFTLIEVLPPQDYSRAHLPGAINIPAAQLRGQAAEQLPNKDMEMIVYGAAPDCPESKEAAAELSEMGYINVRRYVGGKADWISAGFPIASDYEQRTVKPAV